MIFPANIFHLSRVHQRGSLYLANLWALSYFIYFECSIAIEFVKVITVFFSPIYRSWHPNPLKLHLSTTVSSLSWSVNLTYLSSLSHIFLIFHTLCRSISFTPFLRLLFHHPHPRFSFSRLCLCEFSFCFLPLRDTSTTKRHSSSSHLQGLLLYSWRWYLTLEKERASYCSWPLLLLRENPTTLRINLSLAFAYFLYPWSIPW